MLCNRSERALPFFHLDRYAAFNCSVAETVAYNKCSAAFNELCEIRIVILRAGQHDLAAEVLLLIGLACLHLFSRLTQIRKNKILGAGK